jgi:chaperonin GroES
MKTIVPVGWVLVVKPDPVPEKTNGGLYLPPDARDREQAQAIMGTVVSIGDEAWAKFDPDSHRPHAGEKILFAKYAGQVIELDGNEYRILNDQDVLGIVREDVLVYGPESAEVPLEVKG